MYDIFEINTLLENSHISADGYSLVHITLKRLSINEVVTHNACVVIKGKLVKKCNLSLSDKSVAKDRQEDVANPNTHMN